MSLWRLALASLVHFWRTNLALLFGIAVGTAVLTGALIIGDSIRGSLRALTIERLGKIDVILTGEEFFRVELARSLRSYLDSDASSDYTEALPAILLYQATAERVDADPPARAQGLTVVGVTPEFWDLRTRGEAPTIPQEGQIVINQSLADELNASVGDRLTLRVGTSGGLATDSPLAQKSDLVTSVVDLELVDVVPAIGLGRFSLFASQQTPSNAFVAIETLQDKLDQPAHANTILVAGPTANRPAGENAFRRLQTRLRPTIEDLGISLDRITIAQGEGDDINTILKYDTLINHRMVFTPQQQATIERHLTDWHLQPVFTYLATRIQRLDSGGQPTGEVVPYSTVAGIDSNAELGPVLSHDGDPITIAPDRLALNSWAADVLDATPGDTIRVSFFEPETTHGLPAEESRDFVLQAVVPIAEPDIPFGARADAKFLAAAPTLANDPHLTPEVEGITDAETIDRWDAPFPMDPSLIKGRDDDYWKSHRTTPKAFLSLSASQRLWTSRFGEITSFRIPSGEESIEHRRQQLSDMLAKDYETFGLRWIRAKQDGLDASKGTTPFDALFLGFSLFIISSALLLVALMLRLGIEYRAPQLGLVSALGFDWKQRFQLLLAENTAIVLLGSLLGVSLGVGYAWLMLAGLRTWWLAAVVTPFMKLFITRRALVLGFTIGVVASLFTIVWTLRRLRRLSTTDLMAGKTEQAQTPLSNNTKVWARFVPWSLLVVAISLAAVAPSLPPEPQGGAFFGAGTCVLIALLAWVVGYLRRTAWISSDGVGLDLNSLATRNLARNPTRSAQTIGLVASACFLIIAISAFRLAPSELGTGGFELVGTSQQPIHETMSAPDGVQIFALRMQEGDDASCRNLYQSSRPRLIGVPQSFIDQADQVGKMDWFSVQREETDGKSEWHVLSQSDSTQDAIPVVLDKNTAMYGMQIYTGVGTEFERDYGPAGVLKFRIVGLLSGSIFQGSLLVPEHQLTKHFPRVGGFRYFLVDVDHPDLASNIHQLEESYSDQGLDLTESTQLLSELLAVQNTYLSTFQSLGGLGLMLGTFGLAAVQLRNVIQRRSELALLRATGFRNRQLSRLVIREHSLLLTIGVALGVASAMFVILPHLAFGGASIPIVSLAATLGLVAVVGMASAFVAQRSLQKTPLLPALRGD